MRALTIGRPRVSHAVRAAAAVGTLVAVGASFAQPDPGQPRTAPVPTLGSETGKTLSSVIELLNAGEYAAAQNALSPLDLEKLSSYERSKVEQVLFNLAYAQEDYAAAQQHLRNAVDAGGLNAQEVSQARYQAAQVLMTQENWREGAAALEEWFATAVTPNAATYYLLAVAYYQLEDFERALPAAQQAVDLMSEPQEGWISMLVALRLQNKQYKDAIPLLQRLVAIAPGKKTYWLQLSSLYGQVEDYPNALGTLQVAYNTGLITGDAEIRRLADLLLFQHLPYRGAEVLESAIANESVRVDDKLLEQLANCWLAAGEIDKAVVPLERAAELADGGTPFVRLGEVNLQREDWTGAQRALERGLSKGNLSDAGNAQMLMGIALYNQQRLTEARAWFQRSLQSERHRGLSRRYLDAIEWELAIPESHDAVP